MKFRRRTEEVDAHQYDGSPECQIRLEALLAKHVGQPVKLSGLMDKGTWIVLQDGRHWHALPDKAFRQVYVPVNEGKRSCFTCVNFCFSPAGAGYCPVYDEAIHSELAAAEDCPSYEQEGS